MLIRCKNEAASLPRTLQLLQAQSVRPGEIIAVDSGSTDGSLEILASAPGVRILHIPQSEFSYGRSLNIGCRAARFEVVACLSAHAFPKDKSWLEALLRPFGDPSIAGVYGRQLPHDDASPLVRGDTLRFYSAASHLQWDPARSEHHLFSTANAALRRSWWEKRPFDESLPYAEDIDWARAALRRCWRIAYRADAAVCHSHEESWAQLYRRTRKEYEAYRAIYGVHRGLAQALGYWFRASRRDISELRGSRGSAAAMMRAPLFRLAKALGSLSYGGLR